ncbi:MAG: molybdopterin-dependent oxidoreductase [Caulobacter sp. 12-67-6]|nr:MAG: molybdopterin-dependent oxidoreductase [Caulobacter sp. 12-67-6]OYX71820.1 MAG: molybdopterin-dependent oxidoreductase [Caulobacter sp. 32-67-35]OZA71018.1 MAG: molybdopterin-dependent oxidoreductase [Caulobacter sp. 39-67-4]HQR89887.1 molybdopterin-dependent oxidoreductase [Caulobacter sp.]
MRILLAVTAAIALLASPVLAQDLKVTVAGRDTVMLTPAEVKALPRAKATITVKGQPVVYEGAVLHGALLKAGVVSGERLMGRYLNQIVVLRAADGFSSILSIAETDPVYRANPVILADTVNGKPLDAREGPYRVVVDGDLRNSRSPRGVVSIEVKAGF